MFCLQISEIARNSALEYLHKGFTVDEYLILPGKKLIEPRFARIIYNLKEEIDYSSHLFPGEKLAITNLYNEINTGMQFSNYKIPRIRKINKGIFGYYLKARNSYFEDENLEYNTFSQILLDIIGFWKNFIQPQDYRRPESHLTYEERFVIQYGWKKELAESYTQPLPFYQINYGDPAIEWRYDRSKGKFVECQSEILTT